MKLEIEAVSNGYVITIPKNEFEAFTELINHLADFFGVQNSKHNTIGYINGLCSEYERYDIIKVMEKSLKDPRNDLGDEYE